MDILVLKINQAIASKEALKARAEAAWKISPIRLKTVHNVIVMHDGKVVAEYQLLPDIKYNLESGRAVLSLADIDKSNATGLVGKSLNYGAVNPCTIDTLADLQKRIK